MDGSNYNEMSTVALRTLVRERGLAQGAAVASARKEDLIALLTGVAAALPAAALPEAGDVDLADVIARAISGRVRAGLDTEAVQAMIDASLATVLATVQRPNIVNINMPELPGLGAVAGAMHRQLPQVLAWLRANVPVWLWGAAGAGKTHFARQIAAAMGLDACVIPIDETTTANKLLGFQNLVSGEFVKGWLYEPYKNGALVMIDEIDTGNPGILAGLNALLANDYYLFPNGETVQRHANFRVIAAANTNGTGAVAGYVARNRLDAATLNRFAIIEMVYDEGLELALTCGIPSQSEPWQPCEAATPAACEAWVRWVQSVRAAYGKSVLVSPRASMLGVRALRGGIPTTEVADALVFALCSADTRRAIESRCGMPAVTSEKAA